MDILNNEKEKIEKEQKYCEAEKNRLGFYGVLNEYPVDEILSQYGPEGSYILANALIKAADEDMRLALEECDPCNPFN
jgi:hypothetical protein